MAQQFNFDTQGAMAAGYSPQQIQQYISSRAQQGVNLMPTQTATPQPSQPPQPKGNGALDLLPLIGSVAGSFTPLGPIAGGALGGAAGQGAENLLGGGGNVGDVAKQGLLGGLGGIAGKALGFLGGKALDFLGGGLAKGGDAAIASQYNIGRPVARTTIAAPSQPLTKLADYGITNINDVIPKSESINNIISPVVRQAVGQSNPVDTTGVMDLAKNIAANPAIPQGVDNKFVQFVNKGLQDMHGGPNGSLNPLADPSNVYGFIKNIEGKISDLYAGKSPAMLPSADKALVQGYKLLHDELEQRLFTGTDAAGNVIGKGADSIVANGIFTPEQMTAIQNISPKLAQDVSSVSTVGELRHLLEPFTKGSIAARETEAGSHTGLQNIGGMAKGFGKYIQNPLNLIAMPLSSDTVNAAGGNLMRKAGSAIKNSGGGIGMDALAQTAGQSGVRAPLSLLDAQSQQQNPMQAPDVLGASTQASDINQPTGNTQQENLKKILAYSILSRARTPGDLKTAFDVLYPLANKVLSPQQQEVKANAQSGLRALDVVQNAIQNDPYATVKAKIPGLNAQSPYLAATKEVADVLTRLRTGAALNKQEEQFYSSQLPQPMDSPQTVAYKMSIFRDLFNQMAHSEVSASSLPATQ